MIQNIDERELMLIIKQDPNLSSVKLTFFNSKQNQYFEYENRNSAIFKSSYSLSEAPATEAKEKTTEPDLPCRPGIASKTQEEPLILKRSTRLKKKIKKYNSYE